MTSSCDKVWLRVERAKEQRRDLEREMRAWCEAGAYTIATQLDAKTGNTLFYVEEIREITPLIASLIGEIIHTLRTALDHLAYQLFLASRADPADEGTYVEFPVYDDAKKSEAKAFRPIESFRQEIIEVFKAVNPCKSGNPLLWVLHRLDIVDKHRRIITSFLAHHSIFVRDAFHELIARTGNNDLLFMAALRHPFLTSPRTGRRVKLGDIVFKGMPGDEEVNKKLQFTFDVAFDEFGIIEGKSVIETLDEMLKLVEGIVSSFDPFLI